jgi:hypothetical protein
VYDIAMRELTFSILGFSAPLRGGTGLQAHVLAPDLGGW